MPRTSLAIRAALIGALALPAAAQDPAPEGDGPSLFEQGTRLILRGLAEDLAPHMRELHQDLDKAMADWEPALRQLMDLIGDIRSYHPPEMLPNGDIILRKKTPEEMAEPDSDQPPAAGPEIEL